MSDKISFTNNGFDITSFFSSLSGKTATGNSANKSNLAGNNPANNDKTANNQSAAAVSTVDKFAAAGFNVGNSSVKQDPNAIPTSSTVPGFDSLTASGASPASAIGQIVASSFVFAQNGVSSTLNNASAYNALNVQGSLNKLASLRPYNSLTINQTYGSSYLAAQNATFDAISQNLSDLSAQASALQDPNLYNLNVAGSSNPGVVSSIAGPEASQSAVSINVTRLAAPEILSSAVPTTSSTKTVTTTTQASVATPAGVSAAVSSNGGSLNTGTHYFRVSAIDSSGHESAASQEISAVTSGGKGSVTLSWNGVSDAKSYRVYVGSSTGNESSYYTSNDNNLKVTGSGNGVHDGTPLDTGVSFATTSTNTVTTTTPLAPNSALGYSGSFSVNGRQVNVGSNDSLNDIANNINSGSLSPSGLSSSAGSAGGLGAGTYYYRISAVDSLGNESAASPLASATANGNGASVLMSWNKMDNAESYKVFFGTSQSNLSRYYLVDGRKTSFSDVGAVGSAISGSPTLSSSANGAFGFGTPQYTGVSASVSSGQLLLTSQNGGNMALSDPNGVLKGLGILYANPANNSTVVNNLNPQYQAAQSAVFSVNGTRYSSATNGSIQAGGFNLNLTGTGSTVVSATKDPSSALRSVANFVNSYNQAVNTINNAVLSGGAMAQNPQMQDTYSGIVRFLNSPSPSSFNGVNSLSDIGINISGRSPTNIQETSLDQLASKLSNNPSSNAVNSAVPAGQGPLSLVHQSGSMGLNSSDNFHLRIDPVVLTNSFLRNPVGTGEMLDYAASRLQSRLNIALQPGYGTLAFQKQIIGYYESNQQLVSSIMSGVVGITTNSINSANFKTLLASL